MLIEFSVENYKSIKERQTLSLVSANSDGHNLHKTGFEAAPDLTATTAIYGPNGSGKSNLISALKFFKDFVINSAKMQEGDEIEIEPFLFSEKTQKKPSIFEIAFIQKEYLFQYGFSVDTEKVHDEWLFATSKKSQNKETQTWYDRTSKDKKINESLKGDKEIWLRLTRDNALFLSTSVQLNSSDFRKPFEWIREQLIILDKDKDLNLLSTMKKIQEDEDKNKILKFMKGLDASFDDIIIVEKTVSLEDIKFHAHTPENIKQDILKDIVGRKTRRVYCVHNMEEGGTYHLPLTDESDGTQKLFAFAAPILDVLEKGQTLIVDEINNSLHPIAFKGILSLFQNPKINKKNAQILFTTHDTNTMNYLSRNEIWLLDKGKFGDTKLTALAEFKGSENEPIEKYYLGGRYGALPYVSDII